MATAIMITIPYNIPLPPSPPEGPSFLPLEPMTKRHFTSFGETETPDHTPEPSSSFTSTTEDSYDEPDSSRRRADYVETATSENLGRKKGFDLPQLDDFALIRVLGKGCAGRVLLVKHTVTNAVHAMKAVSKRAVLAYDELHHTLTEQRILKRFAISDPDNTLIAKLKHSFTDRENFYFVMDFYPGGDLATQMEIHGILGHHRMRFYAADLVQGLEDLHRHGIIVRDLKPENILLNAKGHAVLADFGLSKEFPYRGEPKAMHVFTYPGSPELPEHAGAGAGSSRVMPDGKKRLVVDRAFSFVGTAEYLAPEVVKRGAYSYAVDWWALGCIVLEGLIGRVPFRQREGDAAIVLWKQILHDPWDAFLNESPWRSMSLSEYELDAITCHFIDALLTKDPMLRLTEPFVKDHPYFSQIEWTTVRNGEYEDPYGLQLHVEAEYNTRYFPKLCLDEVPSVDMSTHELRSEGRTKTALNDNDLYALEQARYRAELEEFAWSWDQEVDMNVDAECSGWDRVRESSVRLAIAPGGPLGDGPASTVAKAVDKHCGSPNQEAWGAERTRHIYVPDGRSDIPPSSPLLLPATMPSIPPIPSLSINSPIISKGTLPLSTSPPKSPPVKESRAVEASNPVPIKPARPNTLELLPGMPSSGLSVSDVISVSPGLGSLTRFIRRHPRLPTDESVSMARLSVELDGNITALDDEDWEELEGEPGESAPNGDIGQIAPSTFIVRGFNQVLRHRSSNIGGSALHRQTKAYNSSRESSPTKPRSVNGLFSAKSLESTKKALERFKAFPRLRKRSQSGKVSPLVIPPIETMPSLPLQSVSATPPRTTPTVALNRPAANRRNTESGRFDLRPRVRKQISSTAAQLRGSRRIEKSASDSSSSAGGTVGSEAPKVELTRTEPILWEIDGGNTSKSKQEREHVCDWGE